MSRLGSVAGGAICNHVMYASILTGGTYAVGPALLMFFFKIFRDNWLAHDELQVQSALTSNKFKGPC